VPDAVTRLAGEEDGLLHDASNLIGALGLYCDLLSMPRVLKPEHRHYAEELRLLGTRSAAMIERLIEQRIRARQRGEEGRFAPEDIDLVESGLAESGPAESGLAGAPEPFAARAEARRSPSSATERPPRGLRSMIERSAGLLTRVAGGRAVEITYGAAAAMPVRVPEESVERILVNLVHNAARAMDRARREGAIQVRVGMLDSAAGPWPFQCVRLAIEDCGCGMDGEELGRLLADEPTQARHGIGFRVVRQLAAQSRGELSVVSTSGQGTEVWIDWPLPPPPQDSGDRDSRDDDAAFLRHGSMMHSPDAVRRPADAKIARAPGRRWNA
jgi:signal transduction histidine kinase